MTMSYQRAQNVLWRRTATSVVIRTIDGRGVTLSATGRALWDALAEPRRLSELTDLLHAAFADPSGALDGEVAQTLRQLEANEMLVTSDER